MLIRYLDPSPKHSQLLRLDPIASLPLAGFQRQQSGQSLLVCGKTVQADPAALPDPAPFPVECPLPKQIGQHGQPIEPGNVLRRDVLFQIGLHGSEMILAGDFESFGLFGANILLGAFDAGMAEQQLSRAQVAGLLVDMGREGPAQ